MLLQRLTSCLHHPSLLTHKTHTHTSHHKFAQALPPAALAQLQQGTMALEAAVVLLEAVLPSLLDALPSEGPGFRDSTNALLQPLLPLRYTDPVMISLVS
jgi:hypothetical protein